MIMPGVTIGKGAIVLTGSVVTKDIEPWTIVDGNPAKIRDKNRKLITGQYIDIGYHYNLINRQFYQYEYTIFIKDLRNRWCDSSFFCLSQQIYDRRP